MKITLELKKVLGILDIASRFVSKNATLPILQNIYLKASIDNTLIIRATDMEKYIEIELPCNVDMEGAITVSAKIFLDIIKATEDEMVEFSVDQKTSIMTIKTPKDTFSINGIPASEYVALPEVPQENSFTLDTTLFSKGLDKVEYAITDKSFTPVLTGMLMKSKIEDNQAKIVFCGSDSFRLSEYKTHNTNSDEFSLIIPKVTIGDIGQVIKLAVEKETPDVVVKYSNNLIAFELSIGDIKIIATSLLIQGSFPEYEREQVLPTNYNTTIMVDKNDCDKAIKKVGIITRDLNNFLQIDTKESKIIITSGQTEKGTGETEIPAIIEGEPVSFSVNGRYISDFIRTMGSDTLIFNVVNGTTPIVLTDKEDSSNRYVVRPLLNM